MPVTQPIAINPPKPVPLISGIICARETASPETYYQYFAYFELAGLASSPSDRALKAREALFTDQTYQPSMWNVLIKEALFRLGTDYRRYLKRGQPQSTGKKLRMCTIFICRPYFYTFCFHDSASRIPSDSRQTTPARLTRPVTTIAAY
jgi:hypothetical protein